MESEGVGQEDKNLERSKRLSLGEELYHLDNELGIPRRLKSSSILSQLENSSSTRYFTLAKLLLVLLFVLVGVIGVNYFGFFPGKLSLENKFTGNAVLSDESILSAENNLSGVGEIEKFNTGTQSNLSSELFLVIPFVIITVFSLYNLNIYLDIKTKLKNRIKIN